MSRGTTLRHDEGGRSDAWLASLPWPPQSAVHSARPPPLLEVTRRRVMPEDRVHHIHYPLCVLELLADVDGCAGQPLARFLQPRAGAGQVVRALSEVGDETSAETGRRE